MAETGFELLVSILAGIALAAAAGIRAFLPLLIVNLAARFGWVHLNPHLDFLGSDVALVALLVATVLELLADKVPLVDHLLDVCATVLRPAAGILAGMATIAELPRPLAVAMALVLGTISLATQLGRAKARLGSTVMTGGVANPLISAFEDMTSGTLAFLAVVGPVIAGAMVVAVGYLFWRIARRAGRARAAPRGSAAG
jgi:hypothetical protein